MAAILKVFGEDSLFAKKWRDGVLESYDKKLEGLKAMVKDQDAEKMGESERDLMTKIIDDLRTDRETLLRIIDKMAGK